MAFPFPSGPPPTPGVALFGVLFGIAVAVGGFWSGLPRRAGLQREKEEEAEAKERQRRRK
jgi:hypothetical protein